MQLLKQNNTFQLLTLLCAHQGVRGPMIHNCADTFSKVHCVAACEAVSAEPRATDRHPEMQRYAKHVLVAGIERVTLSLALQAFPSLRKVTSCCCGDAHLVPPAMLPDAGLMLLIATFCAVAAVTSSNTNSIAAHIILMG
jgi:hypothetical protein